MDFQEFFRSHIGLITMLGIALFSALPVMVLVWLADKGMDRAMWALHVKLYFLIFGVNCLGVIVMEQWDRRGKRILKERQRQERKNKKQ